MRTVCVVLTSRTHFARSLYTLNALRDHPDIKLQIVLGASAILGKYGDISKEIEKEGFKIDRKVTMLLEGQNPISMAKTTGLGLIEFATVFEDLNPDIVLLRGDRYEILGPVIAAAYTNRVVAHIEGGDVTGTIDESVRHAVTKLAHIHFPTTEGCASRLRKMGEPDHTIHMVGSQEVEFLANTDLSFPHELFSAEYKGQQGMGPVLDLTNGYLIVLQHPVTSEYGSGLHQIKETLQAVNELQMPTIMIWPNVDAGSNEIYKGIREFMYEQGKLINLGMENVNKNVHFFRHIKGDMFARLLQHASCLIGNSSAGIKESSFLGTPVVNIGTRQQGRERGRNVKDVGYSKDAIVTAVKDHLQNGTYEPDHIYGDGKTAAKIADVLASCPLDIQKKIAY